MRPRHKAAEYRQIEWMACALTPASMRPRHKAAEYVDQQQPDIDRERRAASMRPRHKAAEYGKLEEKLAEAFESASMRPRHKAAEYITGMRLISMHWHCFNEAAA